MNEKIFMPISIISKPFVIIPDVINNKKFNFVWELDVIFLNMKILGKK